MNQIRFSDKVYMNEYSHLNIQESEKDCVGSGRPLKAGVRRSPKGKIGTPF